MYCQQTAHTTTRRQMLANAAYGVGAAALSQLLPSDVLANRSAANLHHKPRAKRVIFLFQSGGPSHLDLFDYKPEMRGRFNEDIPPSVFGDQRLTGMVSGQSRFPVVPTKFSFTRCGESGMQISNLLPHTQKIADSICLVNSANTEAVNHDPAITFLQTGFQIPGRPSMGAWVDYGLGTENQNLPAFVVMNSTPSKGKAGQGLLSRLWGSGFLPSRHQGVPIRSVGDPVLYLSDPPGISRSRRREMLDTLSQLNTLAHEETHHAEIETRIAQYEMAYRMQASVPELVDFSDESEEVFDLYGSDSKRPGTYAANCLMARRLAERGVRFIQLYHRGWDHHGNIHGALPVLAKDTDQASAALVLDLKRRGLLDDTLIVWAGEFGRTPYAQGNPRPHAYGRDHHGKAFSFWMAGAGLKQGHVHGLTDDYGFNVADGGMHVHDIQATIMHLLGINHERLTYRYQGRQYRLTDVHGHVEHSIMA